MRRRIVVGRGIIDRMRFVALSLALHVIAIAWLASGRTPPVPPSPATPPVTAQLSEAEVTTVVVLVEEPSRAAGGGQAPAMTARLRPIGRSRVVRSEDAWQDVTIRVDGDGGGAGSGDGGRAGSGGTGTGTGTGIGDGTGIGFGSGTGIGDGTGIGFGSGGGVRVAEAVPAPPAIDEPPPSKARAAKLVWPTRNLDVEDDANLFVARVTVDEAGEVVGARMVKTRPGARADRAASAIWQFRYAPALDDRGLPVRSTFEQPFQVR